MPPPLPRGGLGIPQSFASSPEAPLLGELSNEVRLRGWTKDSLTDSPCCTQPLRHACGVPPPLPRGGLGIPQSLASSPEAPLLGELAGASPTERLDKGQPDREALAKLNLSVTADAVPPPLPRGGLGIPQSFAFSPEAPLLGELANEVRLRGWTKDSLTGKLLLNSTSPSRLTPCHLPYRGEALAFRKALPLRQRLPY